MKKHFSTILLVAILLLGLSLLLYPAFSNYWNTFTQTRAIASYTEQLTEMDEEAYAEIWAEVSAYNDALNDRQNPYLLSGELQARYNELLDISGTGVIGYIDIPRLNVELPIYHGVSNEVLQVAAGHLEWTSLPEGGVNRHSAISGHRGLPSARLFTDLDQLAVGDYFEIYVLGRMLTYEVDQVLIVDPDMAEDLLVVEGKDLFTLVTCTPYGINSHRLLVRGHRVENLMEAQTVRVTADAFVIEKLVVAPFLLMPLLLVMITLLLVSDKQENRRNRK